MDFHPHSDKQEDAIFSEADITICGTGIQWGKSRVGAIRSKLAVHTFTDPEDNFLIVAPTYKIMNQSTLPAFKAIMAPYWDKGYSASAGEFRMPGGGTVYFRTGTDPDSIVGVTNVRHVWGDEAGKFSLYFWENIQARAAFKKARITLTTSPYALNWIYKEFIRPKMRDASARPDCKLITATSAENPYFPKDVYEQRKMTMDPRRFNALFGGKWDKMAGLVYDCFDDVENVVEPFALPSGTQFVAGIDWGYTAPFVLKVRAVTPDNQHYAVHEIYKTGMTLAQKIEAARHAKHIWGVKVFYCDPEDPASIASFNEARMDDGTRLSAVPADNDVRKGIDCHYELVKSRRYKVFRGSSPFTMDEYETYHYPDPDDVGPDDDVREEKPVKQSDHAMDVERYISLATRHGARRLTPHAPGDERKEDQVQRIERLKRRPGKDTSEKWTA